MQGSKTEVRELAKVAGGNWMPVALVKRAMGGKRNELRGYTLISDSNLPPKGSQDFFYEFWFLFDVPDEAQINDIITAPQLL